ncbi:IclR family transcriptional regulator [Thioclava nitratireducens]|uniref:IclR family transcriptional regulator n=1 Tax=Thioclava nitratireducens TaxID=1915078 RepID=UPI00247FECBA|nr:IclR family transcriptional regulator [Thioclava nitratireducens]WGT52635.1 IclR family transcriptional regulator [Thioclava nitratireducens]
MEGKGSPRQHVQSVVVGARLLEALARRNDAMSLSAIAKVAGMAPEKAHRYLAGFIETGLITQNETTGLYDLGPLSLDLGLAAIRRLDVVELAYPRMVALREETGETTSLSVWGNFGATLVRWVPSNAPVNITVNVGSVLPMLTSSNGRAFAAYLPSEITDPMIEKTLAEDAQDLAAAGIETRQDVDRILESVRETGIAAAVGLVVPAIASLSCPIFDRTNSVVAVITVVGITGMISTEKDSPVSMQLRQTAARISEMLGAKVG